MTSKEETASDPIALTRHSALGTRHFTGWLLLLSILALYALLQNPFWVRAGDSEVYLSLARSLAQGTGLRFNAQPVGLVPPGWPLLLSWAMRLTPQFAVLKLMLMVMTAATLWIYFFVLDRLVGWRIALLATALCAILPTFYRLTYQFLAEPMFCVIAGAALLLALRINRRNGGPWEIAGLTVLCFIALSARWTIVLFWPVIAGLLLRGELRPRVNARWIAVAVTGIVTLVSFVEVRHYLRVSPKLIDPRFDASLSTEYAIMNGTNPDDTFASRLHDTDRWMYGLLWPGYGLSDAAYYTLRSVSIALLIFFLIGAVEAARRREWVWIGVIIYYLMLSVNWPSPVARYLAPVAPLLLAGAMRGMWLAASWLPAKLSLPTFRGAVAAMAITIGLFDGITFAGDVRDMRAADFYQSFQNGSDQSLGQAARLFKEMGTHSGELAVSRSRATRSSNNFTNSWMRGIHFLSDIAIRSVPDGLGPEPDAQVAKWMSTNRVEFYLYQPSPPAIDRFRWTFWRDPTAKHTDSEWHLYQLHHGKLIRIRLKDDHLSWPASVPGL